MDFFPFPFYSFNFVWFWLRTLSELADPPFLSFSSAGSPQVAPKHPQRMGLDCLFQPPSPSPFIFHLNYGFWAPVWLVLFRVVLEAGLRSTTTGFPQWPAMDQMEGVLELSGGLPHGGLLQSRPIFPSSVTFLISRPFLSYPLEDPFAFFGTFCTFSFFFRMRLRQAPRVYNLDELLFLG